MSLDIRDILKSWPYESGQVTARRITGDDGREKIQLRLDLGLLQMEVAGRPDGEQPFGMEDYVAYYEQQLHQHRESVGSDKGFSLDERACELLRAESLMYYHRYLAEFVLEDFIAVERDTLRNLRLMDLCTRYAADESDRLVLEQYRPYVLMMCARARARQAVNDGRPQVALKILAHGVEKIVEFYKQFGQEELGSVSGEISILRGMIREIETRLPADPLAHLQQELDKAIQEERYEDAAHLRDQLSKEQRGKAES